MSQIMYRIPYLLLLFTILNMNISCQPVKKNQYLVRSITSDSVPDNWTTLDWTQGKLLTDFTSPWTENTNPQTSFIALHDPNYFYFKFEVVEDNLYIYTDQDDRYDVLQSDRVEIFFRKDSTMTPYYCLEMDPKGRVYDYRAQLYRQMDTDWRWPEKELSIETKITDKGYTLFGKISIASLRDLDLIQHNTIEAGLYRGRCLSINEDKATFDWITWIDPKVEKPDFHIPSSFGQLYIQGL